MATTRLIPRHIDKGKSILASLRKSLDYGKNPNKTRDGELISAFGCDPMTADAEFLLAKREYFYMTGREQKRDKDILLYQIRQSFKPGEITSEEANRVSYELAMRWTKGRHAFIVTTHEDKRHIHSHIYYNSTALDCTRKFEDFKRSGMALRRLSDMICAENGLSIIENPKPGKTNYATWLGDNKKPSFHAQLRQIIDEALAKKPPDFEAFIKLMETAGVECARRGKKMRFRVPGQKRFAECDALKGDYTEAAIHERIDGTRIVVSTSGSGGRETAPPNVSLLIDIQAKIQQGKGGGYAHWAKMFNLKEAAKTLVFLQENGLTDYAALEKKTAEAAAAFSELSVKIKQTESRLSEISELQKQISNYSRTREIYAQYRQAGYSKSFRAEHEGDILLHQAAKRHFDSLGLKKLPTIAVLKQEYATLAAEKKKLYQGYREAKETMQGYITVKANTDRLLRYNPAGPEREPQR